MSDAATITEVNFKRIRTPLRLEFVTALRRTNVVESIQVEIRTSNGYRGFGEATPITPVSGETLDSAQAAISDRLGPALTGADGYQIDSALDVVQTASGGRDPSAAAAIDIALHDLHARLRALPLTSVLAERLGCAPPGVTAVSTDMTVSAGPPGQMAVAALDAVGSGFGVLKLKLGDGRDDDVQRVLAVSRAVPAGTVVRLDANQGWNVSETLMILGRLREAGIRIAVLEQPLPADDLEGMAELNSRAGVPILADEAVWTAADIDAVAARGAASIVNIKLMKCGGLRPAVEAVRRAHAHRLGWIVGCMMEGPVGVAAAACLAAAGAPEAVHDLDAAWWQSSEALHYDGDRLLLPSGAGLEGVA